MRFTAKTSAALMLAGGVCLAAFWLLGVYVSGHREPQALWTTAQSVRGHALELAWVLTTLGFAPVLAPLWAGCIALGVCSREWRSRAFYAVLSGLLSWIVGDRLQHLFHRPRRDDWLVQHVHAFSYPSTHASISTGFYFLWGVLLLRSNLSAPVRYGGFGTLTLLTLAIQWSRLSLAAHYPTDLIGGTLLGLAVIFLGAPFVKSPLPTRAEAL